MDKENKSTTIYSSVLHKSITFIMPVKLTDCSYFHVLPISCFVLPFKRLTPVTAPSCRWALPRTYKITANQLKVPWGASLV